MYLRGPGGWFLKVNVLVLLNFLKIWTFGDKTCWICESKWWETKKVDVKQVQEFLEFS